MSNKKILLLLITASLSLLTACGGSGFSPEAMENLNAHFPPDSNGLAADTSSDLAKDILSRYGYSVKEFWQIVDRARTEGNMYFMPINSQIRLMMQNCAPVVTQTETLERIELVDSVEGLAYPDFCKVEFLYEKTISGPDDNQSMTIKMVMKFKDPSFNEFYDFQSLECHGSGKGSETTNSVDAIYFSQCRVVDSFYGEFQSSSLTHVNGLDDAIKVTIDADITTPGRPDQAMLGGTAQVQFDYNSVTGTNVYNLNGEISEGFRSEWELGLRVN